MAEVVLHWCMLRALSKKPAAKTNGRLDLSWITVWTAAETPKSKWFTNSLRLKVMAKQEVFAATWKALSISGRSKEIVATEIQTLCLLRTYAD